VIENVDWSLHWIEFGDVSLDVVEAVLVCPAESVSPHEYIANILKRTISNHTFIYLVAFTKHTMRAATP
jgi:hypothetical protein